LWLKAQLYQESLLNPAAVSPVGARGVAQFMPGTWREVCHAMGMGRISPHTARPAIHAAAYYMARLYMGWKSPRPDMDRWDLARASYNAGFGNLLAAQRAAGGANRYAAIIKALPQITGHHSRETITYVERIHQIFRRLSCGPR
jgi:soluble lytic murein transglycosylase-like protein